MNERNYKKNFQKKKNNGTEMPPIKTISGFKKFKDKPPYTSEISGGVWCQFYIPDKDQFWVEYYLNTGAFYYLFKDVELWWKPIYPPKKKNFLTD